MYREGYHFQEGTNDGLCKKTVWNSIKYEGKLIKAITRIINIQRVGFSYSLLFTKIQKLKRWYYTNQVLWIEVISEWWGIFKGTSS